MSEQNLKKWYIDGMHSLRSACEQDVESSKNANRVASIQSVNNLLKEVAEFSAKNEKKIIEMLADLGEQPNDYVEQIMFGINKATDLMLNDSTDKAVTDVALIAAAQRSLHYFIPAFATQAAVAKALGLNDHANTLSAMADECKDADARYSALAEKEVNPKAVA